MAHAPDWRRCRKSWKARLYSAPASCVRFVSAWAADVGPSRSGRRDGSSGVTTGVTIRAAMMHSYRALWSGRASVVALALPASPDNPSGGRLLLRPKRRTARAWQYGEIDGHSPCPATNQPSPGNPPLGAEGAYALHADSESLRRFWDAHCFAGHMGYTIAMRNSLSSPFGYCHGK